MATKKQFRNVTVETGLAGHGMRYCALDDPRASTFYVNSKGERLSAQRIISDVYGVEVRHARRMTGACRELLHSATFEVEPCAEPTIPANTMFIAKAFEQTAN